VEDAVGLLSRFEQRLDSLISGGFSRAFRSDLQPVEVAASLQRECDNRAAVVDAGRTLVPNAFVVEIAPPDAERLAPYLQPLSAELSKMVVEHVAAQRYSTVGEVTVTFETVDDLHTGMHRIRSAVEGGVIPMTGSAARSERGPRLEAGDTVYPLASGTTVIGRGTDADLRLDDPGVSRRHCAVDLRDGFPTVRDLGSTNGTFVDGRRITEATEVDDGAQLSVGGVTLSLRLT
jgi:hypothetical protein